MEFCKLYTSYHYRWRKNLQEQYGRHNFREWLFHLYGLPRPEATMLDLGCGDRSELISFSPHILSGDGVDNSVSQTVAAWDEIKRKGISNINVYRTDAEAFLADTRMMFHIIISNFAFYYIEKRRLYYVAKLIRDHAYLGGAVFIAGSPDENAPEFNVMIRRFLKKRDIPEVYRPGFSDVRKHEELFKEFFKNVHFYRFVNEIKFPNVSKFMDYIKSTTLYQSLEKHKAERFYGSCKRYLKREKKRTLTKIVDVLRAQKIR